MQDPAGEPSTPFHDAARAGDVRTLRAMIEAGADVDEDDWRGTVPLYGSAEAARVLLDVGADPHGAGRTTLDPFCCAAHFNRAPLVRLMLDYGADVHATDEDGETALIYAAWWGNADLVCELLARGASPHVVARKGVTALGYARENGHAAVVELLRAAGATDGADHGGGGGGFGTTRPLR
jgi:ankyrin repeat protein